MTIYVYVYLIFAKPNWQSCLAITKVFRRREVLPIFKYLCKLKVYANNLQIVLGKSHLCLLVIVLYIKLFFSFSFCILIFHLAFFHIALAMSTYVVFMAFLIRHLRYFRLATFCDQHKLGLCLVKRAFPLPPRQ